MSGRRYNKESKLLQFYSKLTQDLGCQSLKSPVWFIGGTMFWVRWESIKFFFDNCNVKNAIDKLRLETGDVEDPSYTHAFERFFGAIPVLHGKKLVGI